MIVTNNTNQKQCCYLKLLTPAWASVKFCKKFDIKTRRRVASLALILLEVPFNKLRARAGLFIACKNTEVKN